MAFRLFLEKALELGITIVPNGRDNKVYLGKGIRQPQRDRRRAVVRPNLHPVRPIFELRVCRTFAGVGFGCERPARRVIEGLVWLRKL